MNAEAGATDDVADASGASPGDPDEGPSAVEVVAMVSHELRSPLTSIKGYTSLLLNRWDRLNDEQKQLMLGQVRDDADRVTRLITELLDISRIETGRLKLARQAVHLPRLVAGVVESEQVTSPALEVSVEVPGDLPEVDADPDKITQVLTNLVENAVKYGDPVGIIIEAHTTDNWVVVSVTDQGQGIATEDMPHVFERFYRREEGQPSGTGLGLWISRGLAEAHGGVLEVTSEPGAGATFWFTLPTWTGPAA